jgi:hypothetical protein
LIDNVWVAPGITDETLAQLPNIDPLVDRDINGLGEVSLRSVRATGGNEDTPARFHSLYTVEKNDYKHALEVTHPAGRKPPKALWLMHVGWGMTIEGSLSRNLIDALAEQFPDDLVIAKSADGMGKNSDRYHARDEHLHGLKAQGITSVALAKAFGAEELDTTIAGLSEGTVTGHHSAYENFYGKPENGPINIVRFLEISPARVDPSHRQDMVLFLGQLGWHIGKRAVRHPIKSARAGMAIADHGLSRDCLPAFSHQLSELLLCATPEEQIEEVTAAVKTTSVWGEDDILAQPKMRQRIEARLPGQMHNKRVRKRGHDIAAEAVPCIRAVSKALVEHSLKTSDPKSESKPKPVAA